MTAREWAMSRVHVTEQPQDVQVRAWELHRANGHPEGYDGPCWGPTLAETEQAAREFLARPKP